TMVPWLKTGHDYHTAHDLQSCLFCGNELSLDRKAKLAAALDDRLSQLMVELRQTQARLSTAVTNVDEQLGRPPASELGGALRTAYTKASDELSAILEQLKPVLTEAERIIAERMAQPTMAV